jgi:hypothetical protein
MIKGRSRDLEVVQPRRFLMVGNWFDVSTRLGLAVVTGLLSTLASFIFWGVLTRWQLQRIRKRIARQTRIAQPGGGLALVLSVARDIAPDVRRHLDANPETRSLPLLQVHQPGGLDLREEVWLRYLEQVKKKWREIVKGGCGQVHLFINMPVSMAVYIGAILMPGPEVIISHFQDNMYHRVGSLTTTLVKL